MRKREAANPTTLKQLYEKAKAAIKAEPGTKKYENGLERCQIVYQFAREQKVFLQRHRGRPKKHCVLGHESRLNRSAWAMAEKAYRLLADM